MSIKVKDLIRKSKDAMKRYSNGLNNILRGNFFYHAIGLTLYDIESESFDF